MEKLTRTVSGVVLGDIFYEVKYFSGAVHFGCFHVSPDDRYLLYIAEKKKPKAVSFFSKPTPPASKDDPAPVKVRGQVEGWKRVGIVF